MAEEKTINGTEKILIKLPIAVNEIDNATSPFANFVKTFDVTPPGAAATVSYTHLTLPTIYSV